MKEQEIVARLSRTEHFKGAQLRNAIIKGVSLTRNDGDRGILGAWLELDYGGTCQGFGGIALYLPKSYTHHKIQTCAGHFLYRVMEVAGVDDWDKLVGRSIRAICTDSKVYAIGHIIQDDFFCPAIDFGHEGSGE